MWNGNNGNGQGNGYGQQPQGVQQGYTPQGGYGQPQDAYARMDNAREVGGARFPYIAAGTHKLALVSLEEFNPQAAKVRALFKTIDSRTQQVGGFCVKIWSLTKPPKFKDGTTEADEFADFMLKLKGAPRGFPISQSIRTLLKERPLEQLARGTVIECTGVAGKPSQTPGKEPYVRVYWNTVANDAASIVAMRQRLEQEGVPNTNDNAQQGQQQMQQQYAPQQMQQPVPPQAQSQYGQQPQMQQYAPQPMQQQAQPPQQGGVPQGGFLANVPTNGPGPQGGQGGGQQGGAGW